MQMFSPAEASRFINLLMKCLHFIMPWLELASSRWLNASNWKLSAKDMFVFRTREKLVLVVGS